MTLLKTMLIWGSIAVVAAVVGMTLAVRPLIQGVEEQGLKYYAEKLWCGSQENCE